MMLVRLDGAAFAHSMVPQARAEAKAEIGKAAAEIQKKLKS
jgi:hypothetical protein